MLPSDAGAGLFLLVFGVVGVLLYGLIMYSMLQMIGEIVGFRFLISQAITDVLLLIQVLVIKEISEIKKGRNKVLYIVLR